jgi:hypothetical protein
MVVKRWAFRLDEPPAWRLGSTWSTRALRRPVILVTGGCRFIGAHVVDALIERGADVRAVDNLLPLAHAAPPVYLNPAAKYGEADVRDGAAIRGCLSGMPPQTAWQAKKRGGGI